VQDQPEQMTKSLTPMPAIRPLTAADRQVWTPLWRAYLAFYETELPEAVHATSFARMTDPLVSDYHGMLAWDGDRAVGLVHYIFHRHGWRIEPVTYLQDLYAVPEARGQGVGRALIEAVYAAADAAGAPSVYWMTQEFNTEARRLYDRVGTLTPFVKYQRP
jgi:GNAT superfamily N-acetyltransferase